jgi:enhancing lycopene biosynthesis protein 2
MSVGVLLGGCGLYDGSDVHETVFLLAALDAAGERPVILAPDVEQVRTVDHLTGDEVHDDHRNVLRESARLTRGSIQGLDRLRPETLEALTIPGGYGPVVNLSTGFARAGRRREVRGEVDDFLRHFLNLRKPIGLVSLGDVPVRTILGQAMEVPSTPCRPERVTVDRARRIVHTPGFAAFERLADVRLGIETMVREVLRLVVERAGGEERVEGLRGER